jgi:hypothetical protein
VILKAQLKKKIAKGVIHLYKFSFKLPGRLKVRKLYGVLLKKTNVIMERESIKVALPRVNNSTTKHKQDGNY